MDLIEDLEKIKGFYDQKSYSSISNTLSSSIEKLKSLDEILTYAQWHVDLLTETIKDYLDDDPQGNKHYIGELKETREYWKDVIRLSKNEETYMKKELWDC